MHNIMHNMKDSDVPLPAHVVARNGVYQYVRRVPNDIVNAFEINRIQRSLKTRLPSEARLRAAELDIEYELQFDRVRAMVGQSTNAIESVSWTWPEWEQFVAWFRASLVEEDTLQRQAMATGKNLSGKSGAIWIDDKELRRRIDLQKELRAMTVARYAAERRGHVQSYAARIGVALPVEAKRHQRLFAGCLEAELEALDIILKRENGQWTDVPHPDMISGRWANLGPVEEKKRVFEAQPVKMNSP